jgi:predicted ATP-binding protein involved in virulence
LNYDFLSNTYFKRNHFSNPISLSNFAYFLKVQKEIIVIIGGPGTGKTTIIDDSQRTLLLSRNFSN